MTAGEDEPQTIVLNFPFVKRSLVATRFKVGNQMALHSIKPRATANPVDGFEACGGDQPRSRIVGPPRLRPGLQICSERIVHRFPSQIQVPEGAHQACQNPGLISTVKNFDGLTNLFGRELRHPRQASKRGGPRQNVSGACPIANRQAPPSANCSPLQEQRLFGRQTLAAPCRGFGLPRSGSLPGLPAPRICLP